MKKLALYRLLHTLRHHLPILIFYYIAGGILIAVTGVFMFYNLYTEYIYENGLPFSPDATLEEKRISITNTAFHIMTENGHLFMMIVILISLILIWLTSRKLPLCLPRAMYACPADTSDKLHYLLFYLLLKSLLLAVLLIGFTVYNIGLFFLPDAPFLLIQLSLTFFTLLAFSLNTDPGNRKEALKKCPDMVTERDSKTFVNIYWSALLLLENTIFYSLLYAEPDFMWMTIVCWIPALILNVWLAKRHVIPVLRTMLDYEKIYYPLPEAVPGEQL